MSSSSGTLFYPVPKLYLETGDTRQVKLGVWSLPNPKLEKEIITAHRSLLPAYCLLTAYALFPPQIYKTLIIRQKLVEVLRGIWYEKKKSSEFN